MKNSIDLIQHKSQNQGAQTLPVEQLHHKALANVRTEPYQQKSLQLHERTTIQHRVCQIEKMADNTLMCHDCGRKFPVTPEGKIDKDQLQIEILARRL
jgi:uncharacterized protein YbaR (Trm112 family)